MVNILKIIIALAPTLHNDMLVIIQKLDLESCPVNVKDVYCTHVGISAEENLPGLSLFLRINVLGDYYLDLPFEAHGPDYGRM